MTAQFGEKLYYKGCELSMGSSPLGSYFAQSGTRPDFSTSCSALWRGYTGTWEIDNGRLFLIDLNGQLNNGRLANVSTIFPHQKRVFASWYSGELLVPVGKMIKHVHMGFASQFEEELVFTIENGKMRRIAIHRNDGAETPAETNPKERIRAVLLEKSQRKEKKRTAVQYHLLVW